VSFPVERLRELRNRAGLSQAKLAETLSVGLRTVIRWEMGHAKPSPLALGALAAFFGEVEKPNNKRKAR